MSNRRKTTVERQESPRYGAKAKWRKPMFNFDLLKTGRLGDQKSPPEKDRSLSGKDRVRARRGQR